MTTTIKSTALDFDAIKNNLKLFLQQQPEFTDYNFEASALSNILDVLAWNTHFNGLLANFATNESYLGTAQLRSSIVSLAAALGYVAASRTSSSATVTLSVNLSGVSNRPTSISLPTGTTFEASVDNVAYTFQTREVLTASDDGNGLYVFATTTGDSDVVIYEGTSRTKTFLVGNEENVIYVIPDATIDISTALVKVFDTPSSQFFDTYTNLVDATSITDTSKIYILRESPNGNFELTFGNGTTLGDTPDAGNKIVVDYLSPVGPDADGATTFTPTASVIVDSMPYTLNVTTVSQSAGGAFKESIESIRKNAPFQYAAQNRMVTATDYKSLVLRNFSNLIKDIQAWGGQDNVEPKFGAVFLSIVFKDGVTQATQQVTKDAIVDLARQLSVISFDIEFEDPTTTYIETSVIFDFNPTLTSLSLNTIENNVQSTVVQYFTDNTGLFEQSFRRSNMLTQVDEVSPSVLSSRAEIKMQQRITPILSILNDFTLTFPDPIATPDDVEYRITSTPFVFGGKTCILQNKLNTTKLQVRNVEDNEVIVDNVGSYDPAAGTVSIVGLSPTLIIGGVDFIKVSVTPANQSSVVPERNNLLVYDTDASFATGVIITS